MKKILPKGALLLVLLLLATACEIFEPSISSLEATPGSITIEKHWEGNAVPENPTATFEVRGPGPFIGSGEFVTQVSITGDASLDVGVPDQKAIYFVNEISWPQNCNPRFAGESRVKSGETAVYINECDVFPTAEPSPTSTGFTDFNNWFGYDDGAGNRIWVDEQGNLNCQAVFSDPYLLAWTTPLDLPGFGNFGFGWKVDKVSGAFFTWFVFLFGGEYEDSELVAFYELRILSDGGVYLVWRDTRTGEEIEIFSGSSGSINQGNATNVVETFMDFGNNNFQFFVNNVEVLNTSLPEYSGGGIGLGCASGEEGTVQYKFYDFSAGH